MCTERAEMKQAAVTDASDQANNNATLQSKDMLHCKSDTKMNRGIYTGDFAADFRRCRSEEITPHARNKFIITSQCLAVRASSSPKDSRAGISVPFISFQESTHTEDVKRKWRCRQIANQQKIAQAQLSCWSRWIHKSRCALSIMHRQK